MKIIIVAGSLLAAFLLLMIPSVNAIEYQNQKNITTSKKETLDYPSFVKMVKQTPKNEWRTILKNIIQFLGKVLSIILAALYHSFSTTLQNIKTTVTLLISTISHSIKIAVSLLFSTVLLIINIIKTTISLSFSTALLIIKAAVFLLISVELIFIIPFIIMAIGSLLP